MRSSVPFLATVILLLVAVNMAVQGEGAHAQTIPQPLRECDVDALTTHLSLSPAQQNAIASMFLDYRRGVNAEVVHEVDELVKLREYYINCRQRPEQSPDRTVVQLYDELSKRINDVRPKLENLGQQFTASMSDVLTDEQLLVLGRVLNGIERSLWRRGRMSIRERHIDVIRLLEELQLAPGECAECAQAIGEFETTYIAALRRVARADDSVERLRNYLKSA